MRSTGVHLFGIAHVKVHVILLQKMYIIRRVGRFVWTTRFVQCGCSNRRRGSNSLAGSSSGFVRPRMETILVKTNQGTLFLQCKYRGKILDYAFFEKPKIRYYILFCFLFEYLLGLLKTEIEVLVLSDFTKLLIWLNWKSKKLHVTQ